MFKLLLNNLNVIDERIQGINNIIEIKHDGYVLITMI